MPKYVYMITYNPEGELEHNEIVLIEEWCSNNCVNYCISIENGKCGGKKHLHAYVELDKYSRTNVCRENLVKSTKIQDSKIALVINDKKTYSVKALGYVGKDGDIFSTNMDTDEIENAVQHWKKCNEKKEKEERKILSNKNVWHHIDKWLDEDYEYKGFMNLMRDMQNDGYETLYYLEKANVKKSNDLFQWKYKKAPNSFVTKWSKDADYL